VTLPALGESVTEGTVTRWLKQVGDEVAVDEPLLEVSTDKVDTEIPSPVAGTLLEIKVEEDETVEVGAELAVIGSGEPASGGSSDSGAQGQDEAPQQEAPQQEAPQQEAPQEQAAKQEEPEQEQPKEEAPAAQEQPKQEAPAKAEEPAQQDGGRDQSAYVTPLVRKLASQHGVDLGSVQGTGVGGRIRKQDVLDAAAKAKEAASAPAASSGGQAPAAAASPAPSAPAASGAPSPLRGTTEDVSRLRKIIAERMVSSLQGSAQLTQVMEVDVTSVARLRESVKEEFLAREGVKLTYLPFFAKAAIDALKQHPKLNAAIDTEKGKVTYFDRENVAFAVDTEKGLLTPVVKDAGDLSIAGLAKKIADVAERTRTNKIGPDELSGGTFTITNLGSFGALFDTPIINQPQVAILGPGAVVKRPVVIDDPNLGETIAVRHMVYLALTYDHRLVDGADAGRFLQEVKRRLESGQFEV
jgi:2-oxoglutarate dehydrogenase E2 component (dihydrolipoamide succinyltransferase)